MKQIVCCLILLSLGSCMRLKLKTDVTQLNRIYQVRPGQTLYALDKKGQVEPKRLTKLAEAALYERDDTLYAEFRPKSLPTPDNNRQTLDQADSASVLFYHFSPRPDQLEQKSPWFSYQLTTFDIDLFTIPFKYRFGTGGRPGELSTMPNLGAYFGLRYDRGRYRSVYLRRERRADIQSFSFGFGGIFSLNPVSMNAFDTNGLVADEYEALGLNYGVATIVGYKALTVGLAVGFENLADRNNTNWIYRQKPWLGLTVGLNLN